MPRRHILVLHNGTDTRDLVHVRYSPLHQEVHGDSCVCGKPGIPTGATQRTSTQDDVATSYAFLGADAAVSTTGNTILQRSGPVGADTQCRGLAARKQGRRHHWRRVHAPCSDARSWFGAAAALSVHRLASRAAGRALALGVSRRRGAQTPQPARHGQATAASAPLQRTGRRSRARRPPSLIGRALAA